MSSHNYKIINVNVPAMLQHWAGKSDEDIKIIQAESYSSVLSSDWIESKPYFAYKYNDGCIIIATRDDAPFYDIISNALYDNKKFVRAALVTPQKLFDILNVANLNKTIAEKDDALFTNDFLTELND